jgi:hypothetical protein
LASLPIQKPDLQGRRIAILKHRFAGAEPTGYLMDVMAAIWQRWSAEIIYVAGPIIPRDVDIAVLHVDLTRVPKYYVSSSRRAATVVNGQILDIRKSQCLDDLLSPNSAWDGPVIVKSDENYFGRPDRLLLKGRWLPEALTYRWRQKVAQLTGRHVQFNSKDDYRVFPSLAAVPPWGFYPGSVVQPFQPERQGNRYVLREYYFFGDHHYFNTELGESAVITSGQGIDSEVVNVPKELLALRKQLGMDFGKFDFVMVDGRAVIYDVNKTPAIRRPVSAIGWQLSTHLAQGILTCLRRSLSS